MALVDVDSWVTEYDSCERLSNGIRAQLTERNRLKRTSPEYTKLSASIQIRLRQFDLELDQLKLKINSASQRNSITVEELERRQRQIEILQSSFAQLQNEFLKSKNYEESNERKQLFANKSSLWESDDDDEPIIRPNLQSPAINAQQFQQMKNQVIENQDRGLEALSATIARQKELSSRLGQEIGVQNEIIDNIAENLEDLDTRVNRETRNIGTINQRDNTCGYWVVIIILFIAILVVAFI